MSKNVNNWFYLKQNTQNSKKAKFSNDEYVIRIEKYQKRLIDSPISPLQPPRLLDLEDDYNHISNISSKFSKPKPLDLYLLEQYDKNTNTFNHINIEYDNHHQTNIKNHQKKYNINYSEYALKENLSSL